MYEQFYLDGSAIPEVFKIADRAMEEKFKPVKVVTAPREVPMPRIHGCPGAIGPLFVTEDVYVKQKEKMMIKREQEKKEMELEIIKLLAQRDRLRLKLGELDPSKKSNSKKIVNYNARLRQIDADLKMWETQSGIHIDELDQGSKIGRFLGQLKSYTKKIGKRIKKFYKRHEDLINGLASIILPVVGGILLKKVFRF